MHHVPRPVGKTPPWRGSCFMPRCTLVTMGKESLFVKILGVAMLAALIWGSLLALVLPHP